MHPSGAADETSHSSATGSSTAQRLARMEAEIASLTTALEELRTRIELLEPNT